MTLRRSNPAGRRHVIDRNDDSGPVRVVAVGERGLLLDALIEAMGATGIITLWADWRAPTAVLDHLKSQRADLVLINLGEAGYTRDARNVIRVIAGHGLLAIVLDGGASPALGRVFVEAGALWAMNPSLASLEELASVIHNAAARRTEEGREQQRAALARQAWDDVMRGSVILESSILTMRSDARRGEDATNRMWRPRRTKGAAPSGRMGGEQGRQV